MHVYYIVLQRQVYDFSKLPTDLTELIPAPNIISSVEYKSLTSETEFPLDTAKKLSDFIDDQVKWLEEKTNEKGWFTMSINKVN